NYLRRQSRLKLRIRAQQIQEELEEDTRLLERVRLIEKRESAERESSRVKVMEDILWMNGVLADQKAQETRREAELNSNLWSEEASKLWGRQEQVWAKEKEAREKLLADVLKTVEEQMERKIA
ncbi:Trichoplein_ keratin filament binding, partial [Caligus rogercresseyi]